MDLNPMRASSNDDANRLFMQLLDRHLAPVRSFVGAVLIGSRIHDEHRPGSDVDCVLIFEEVDDRVIPGEFVWTPDDDAFHSIFEVAATEVGGLQVDAIGRRLSWAEFSEGPWPEGLTHDLALSRVVFERGRDVSGLIARRTLYGDDIQLERLGDAMAWLDYHLEAWRLELWVQRGGLIGAHDQLDAAFEQLVSALHAYNRRWMPWRYRRLVSALKLPWLPADFAEHVESLRTDPTSASLEARAEILRRLQSELMSKLDDEGLGDDVRKRWSLPFRGLGFASSMDAWQQAHDQWTAEQSKPT